MNEQIRPDAYAPVGSLPWLLYGYMLDIERCNRARREAELMRGMLLARGKGHE